MASPKYALMGAKASLKEKDAVAKAAGARGGIGKVAATSPEHTPKLASGMRKAGVEPNKAKFPFDKEGARKAATHTKKGKRPGGKK